MLKSVFKISALTLFWLLITGAGEATFTGSLNFRYITNKDTSLNVYLVKEPFVRLDQYAKNSKQIEGSYIFDLSKNSAKFISPRRKVYGEQKSTRLQEPKGHCTVYKEEGSFEVAGYKCIKYTVRNLEENTEITYFIHHGKFTFFTPLVKLWNRSDKQSVYFLQITGLPPGAMPMKSEERLISNRSLVSLLEFTNVSTQMPPADFQKIPAGYTKFEWPFSYSLSFSPTPKIKLRTPVTKERITLNNSAFKKPETWKPATNFCASSIITAFITNKNSPNVTTVTGIVSTVRIGFTTAFKNANATDTKAAVKKLSTATPGKKLATTNTAIADTISRNKKLMPQRCCFQLEFKTGI